MLIYDFTVIQNGWLNVFCSQMADMWGVKYFQELMFKNQFTVTTSMWLLWNILKSCIVCKQRLSRYNIMLIYYFTVTQYGWLNVFL
jgi:hypothetical protein